MKPILFKTDMVREIQEERKTVTRRVVKPQPKGQLIPEPLSSCWPGYFAEAGTPRVIRPPFFPGDVLYVRETFFKDNTGKYHYKAKSDLIFFENDIGHGRGWQFIQWHPSIHMPKEAARLFLRVTGVRAEKLLNITEKDAIREGADQKDPYSSFRNIWNGTMKSADIDTYGWAANPWVWVIEFERISREEAMKGEVE